MNEMTPAKAAKAALCVILALTLGLPMAGCGNKPVAQPADAHSDEHPDDHADKDEHADAGEAGEEQHDDDVASTTIPADVAQSSGIRVAPVAAGVIADEHEVQGLLTPVEGRVAQVMARFPGPIRAVRVGVGDKVRAGQVLASIESNLSLTTYTVTSPLTGTVLQRAATVGAVAGESMLLFEIVDLSTLWVDLHIFGNDAGQAICGRAHALPVGVPDNAAENQQHANRESKDQGSTCGLVFAHVKAAIVVFKRVFTACHVRSAHGRTPWNH